ncbi:6490c558-7648-4ecb-8657-c85ada259828 [Sclerotinia trifoliorum]|uniref:6490c558-7648-4ecb-8657-c85ada259828 n=1 Tax=Sclerotinia trifoliorum TaxID=28548 RepID=A0A8H2VWV7_9HELO|nr:6490c558-7648-4ecb-8657-c85ada259828 [Sclerotinia trifoliorum]
MESAEVEGLKDRRTDYSHPSRFKMSQGIVFVARGPYRDLIIKEEGKRHCALRFDICARRGSVNREFWLVTAGRSMLCCGWLLG